MTQPMAHPCAQSGSPLLLIASTKDVTVRPHNAINLAAKLKSLRATAVLENYPGLTHEEVVMALSKPFRGKASVLADSVAFLNSALPPIR